MAILYSCWLIIETILIPHGSRKWVLLGHYINPILLVLCQFFLFGKFIGSSMFVFLHVCLPVREVYRFLRYLAVKTFRLMRYSVFQLVVIMELDDASIIRLFDIEAPRERWFDFLETEEDDEEEDLSRSILLYNPSRLLPVTGSSMVLFELPSDVEYRKEGEIETGESTDEVYFQLVVVPEHGRQRKNQQQQEQEFEDSEDYNREEEEEESRETKYENFEEEEEESRETKYENFEEEEVQLDGDLDYEEQDSESFSLEEQTTAIVISETRREETLTEPEIDEFYKNYKYRMRWFDLRLSNGICAVTRVTGHINMSMLPLLESESIGNQIDSIHDICKREIWKSYLYDFEMIYVGQSCLSWEVLHHHYRKVRALAYSPDSDRWVFSGYVAARFQQFWVLVQRFVENCSSGGKRFLNYVQSRSSNGNLLQVPNVAGYLVEACDHNKNEEVISAREVLRIIERTIVVFKDFLEKDHKGKPPLMKFKKILFLDSQVENPNDLELLATLNKELNKKEAVLRDLQRGSSRWWRKKTSSSSLEDENVMMFSMIEMKLLSRVLKMSKISTEQLKWCEGKLNGVQVKKGVITLTSDGSLFPYS